MGTMSDEDIAYSDSSGCRAFYIIDQKKWMELFHDHSVPMAKQIEKAIACGYIAEKGKLQA